VVEKLTPGIGNARLLFRVDGPPGSPDCRVCPQLEDVAWQSWCFLAETEEGEALFLDRKELTLVTAVSSAIASLSKEELRAVGTHCSADETCKDIAFNLAAWEAALGSVLEGSQGANVQNVATSARRLVTTAREVLRKSLTNREAYEMGFREFISHANTQPALLNAFKAVQSEAGAIWGDARVLKYGRIAPVLLAFSTYCRRVLLALGRIDALEARELEESDQQLASLKGWCEQKGLAALDYEQVRTVPVSEIVMSLRGMERELEREMPDREDLRDSGVP
jgi:hypothetical protein